MDHLYEDLPNFHAVLDDLKRQIALCEDSRDALEITPMLLLGPPGVGKTHFAREVAQLLGTGMGFIPMSSMTAGWVLSGANSQWKGARPGKVFETLVDGAYANPLIVVDEIDKAGGEHAYDPLGSLYSLLEHDTAHSFTDEFAEVAIDASQVIWIATANDERAIPEPILNRMNVYEVPMPDADAARRIALRLYASIRAAHEWGRRFDDTPSDAVLARFAEMAPREMRRAWMTALGNAKLARRTTVVLADLPDSGAARRTPIGFVH
jgi:ATP-dependent Lon protease